MLYFLVWLDSMNDWLQLSKMESTTSRFRRIVELLDAPDFRMLSGEELGVVVCFFGFL